MINPLVQKFGRLLVNYCLNVQPEERVGITGSAAGLPLVIEAYRAVIQAGAFPHIQWSEEVFAEILLKDGNDTQLNYVPPFHRQIVEEFECTLNLSAPTNTRVLSGVDPARQQMRQAAIRPILEAYMRRSAANELRWCTTVYPTEAGAQDAEMSLADYTQFVLGACHLDKDDPVAEWRKISERQQRLVDWLNGREEIRIAGPNAELTLSVAGRTFINDDGHYNMPGGEIFTGPVEESVNGWIRFTYPAIFAGREVDGIELHFKDGQVVKATARKNEPFLHSVLETDPGARFLGEFAIGTNDGIQQFTRSILFDEKIGGTLHVALGASYPETGGKNESAVHWDMICDLREASQIYVDGELFYENGRFLQPQTAITT